MSDFFLNILGCGSATPSFRHLPSCQAIEFRSRVMLIDCGECAQLSFRRQRLHFSRITDIFISHLHGDHLLGLPGMLSTMSLHEVGGTINIHIFEKGAELIDRILRVVGHNTEFKINYDILDPKGGQTIIDDSALTVKTFKLKHSVDAVGFRFDEKPKGRHINGPMAKFHGVPHYMMDSLRSGADFVNADGKVIPNSVLTTDAEPSRSYAYCSDTVFSDSVAAAVKGVDTLYHEATYADDRAAKAFARGHSTSRQAAKIATMAGVKRLIIGHYSKSYLSEDPLLEQARQEFPNVIAATEGMRIDLTEL